jgi:hypothetical protein
MVNKEPIPKFATEAEEAEWWYEQRDRLTEKAKTALARGELRPRRLPPSPITEGSATNVTETPNRPDILKLSYVDVGTDQVPPPEAQLWRFMDLAKFVSMLDHQALYFPVLAALDDQFEGALPKSPSGTKFWDKARAVKRYRYNRSAVFVNCWYSRPHESVAMWKIYANRGIAIQTTFGQLSKSVNQRPSITRPGPESIVSGGMVNYIDPNETSAPPSDSDPVTEALTKRQWYRYENEFRLIYRLHSNFDPRTDLESAHTPEQRGVWVSCNLREMISAIVLAPRSPSVVQEAVEAICRNFGLDASSLVHRSRIEEGAPTLPGKC